MTKVRLDGRQVVMAGRDWTLARVSAKVAAKLAGGRAKRDEKLKYACRYMPSGGEVHFLESGAKLAFRPASRQRDQDGVPPKVEWLVYGYSPIGRDVVEVLFPYLTEEQVAALDLPPWLLEELNKKHNPDQALVNTVSA